MNVPVHKRPPQSDGVFSVDKRPQLLQEFDSRREEQYHRKDFAPLGRCSTVRTNNITKDETRMDIHATGKSIVRGHHLPENINTPDHVFGVSTKFSGKMYMEMEYAPTNH